MRVDSIGKSYGGRTVLTAASFDAPAGEVTALVGRNGAGKSTLMKIVAGWIRPAHGWVEFRERRYLQPPRAKLAADGLLYLPVDRSILSPRFTLLQHFDAVEYRFGGADRVAVLERLRLTELAGVRCAALSGGERRRAELAIALLRKPECLLIDEPFQGLSPLAAEELLGVLKEMTAQGRAVVISGHETDWVFRAAAHLVWVHQGTTRQLGSPAQARSDWRFRTEYLGTGPRSGSR